MNFITGFYKRASELTAASRDKIKEKNFALPGDRYPIHDIAHARNALARVSQHGTPEERETVRKKVYAKYPELKENFKEQHGESPTSKENLKQEKLGGLLDFLKKKQEEHLTPENMNHLGVRSRMLLLPMMSGVTGKSIGELEEEMRKYKGIPVQIVNEKTGAEQIPGGKADGVPDSMFDPKQLAAGRKIEKEHTKNKKAQTEITKDHIIEADMKDNKGRYVSPYYDELDKVEEKIKKQASWI